MNHKQSRQRQRLLEVLKQHPGHLRAEEVYSKMKEKDDKISLATVYRNLNLLSSLNQINRIDHPNAGSMYDGRDYPHYHLHCLRCDNLIDVPGLYLAELNETVSERMNAKIFSQQMIFEGICEECLKKESTKLQMSEDI